ncbi:MAG: serine hydrolase, partial [Flavobacteriaceae bacterium]|nr:serine hydrolase [Flavobacteriaceae bacterium]
ALDDDVRKYLDGDYPNLEFQGSPITIKNLLTHSLGLKEKTPNRLKALRDKIRDGTYNKDSDSYSIQDLLIELQSVEVNKKPGTVFAYNSVGPELLAYILEKVNNQTFEAQMKTFFKEIGMNNTYLLDYDHQSELLVNGYRNDTIADKDISLLYGAAGGAVATLPDVATYMKYLIENKNELWINEASRTLFVDNEDGEQIGYLWQSIGEGKEEGYFYSKTGTSNGIQSGVLICPGTNYGIVLMVNNTSEEAYNDWGRLFFNQIEPDLIKYPKINLFSTLEEKFINNPESAFNDYRALKKDTTNYFSNTASLNNFGYQMLNENKKQKSISIFKFITEEFPNNANAYDSLGEAYFVIEDYDNALMNYKKSLELNPDNNNAKIYIEKIEMLRQK